MFPNHAFRPVSFSLLVGASLIGALLVVSFLARPAFAQAEATANDPSCLACHEVQYSLYDTGKWYCLYKTPVRCTECHKGRTDTMVEDLAHEGLIAYPLVEDAAVCRDCHPSDDQARVEKFASIAGVSSTPRPYATTTPSAWVSQPPDSAGGARLLQTLPPGAWQVIGISLLGIAFLVVFWFAFHCWKVDQRSRVKLSKG